jgi:cytoskeletal protein CcmA (bactofilin family)
MGIFGKTVEAKPAEAAPKPLPSTPAAAAGKAARPSGCVIGAKTVIKGEVTGEDDVIVEGSVEGQIRIARDLHIAEEGSVKANIDASSVIVAGEIVGDCHASNKVEIQASGRMTGNIRAPRIVIAEGAVFKGNSDMSSRKDTPQRPTHAAAAPPSGGGQAGGHGAS